MHMPFSQKAHTVCAARQQNQQNSKKQGHRGSEQTPRALYSLQFSITHVEHPAAAHLGQCKLPAQPSYSQKHPLFSRTHTIGVFPMSLQQLLQETLAAAAGELHWEQQGCKNATGL
jgi:hypothetical protein